MKFDDLSILNFDIDYRKLYFFFKIFIKILDCSFFVFRKKISVEKL